MAEQLGDAEDGERYDQQHHEGDMGAGPTPRRAGAPGCHARARVPGAGWVPWRYPGRSPWEEEARWKPAHTSRPDHQLMTWEMSSDHWLRNTRINTKGRNMSRGWRR